MGYTHYFAFGKENDDHYKIYNFDEKVKEDILSIIKRHQSILESQYTVDGGVIIINGNPNHETLYIEAGDQGFCKTNRKPYDIAVCEILLVLKHHYGEEFTLESDGFSLSKHDFEITNELDFWSKAEVLDENWCVAFENVLEYFGYRFELEGEITNNEYYNYRVLKEALPLPVIYSIKPHIQQIEDHGVNQMVETIKGINNELDHAISINRLLLTGDYLQSEKNDTQIDVILEYQGEVREDDLFTALKDKLFFNDIKVEFIPINIGKRGNEILPDYSWNVYGDMYPIYYSESYVEDICKQLNIKIVTEDNIEEKVEIYLDEENEEADSFFFEDDINLLAVSGKRFIACELTSDCNVEDYDTLESALYWHVATECPLDEHYYSIVHELRERLYS